MSLDEQIDDCKQIHDILSEHWNWAYYDTAHSDTSWLLAEYVNRLKTDVENRVPIIIEEIRDILKDFDDKTFSILDVGCGVGGFLEQFFSLLPDEYQCINFKAAGIDISEDMISFARQNLRDFNVELYCDSITDDSIQFVNEPFDVAILMVTLSFYNDDNSRRILTAIRDRLKENGLIVIMDFAWTYKWSDFTLFSKPLQKLTDMFFSHLLGETFKFTNRTEEQLNTLITESGYKVINNYLSEKKSKMRGMQIFRAERT